MASTLRAPLPPRDLDALEALARCPLTAAQLLNVSSTFAYPFTSQRKTRARMQILVKRRLVRCFHYLSERAGVLNYYRLSPEGFRLLYGPDASLPSRHTFGPVGIARLTHTQSLSAFIVQTAVAAHNAEIPLVEFHRENSVRLDLDGSSLYPDGGFALGGTETPLRFFVELDTGSERVKSEKIVESWERKIRFYDQYQDRSPDRFRVLMVTTAGEGRMKNLLRAAAEFTRKPERSLFYAVRLDDYLASNNALRSPSFTDHQGRSVALVPAYLALPQAPTLARVAPV